MNNDSVATRSLPFGYARYIYSRWIDNQVLVVPWVCLATFVCVCISISQFGLPLPKIQDEFVYLLQADTFAHGRLTNPPLELADFFQNYHLLTAPTYTGKYPPGQGLILALGQLAGHPILGVWLTLVLMCGAVAWAIKRLVPPVWAIAAGMYCAVHFCIWHYWAISYWGGSLAAFGGALMLGATLRLLNVWNVRNSFLLGLGIVILIFTRPFEGGLLCLIPAIMLFRCVWAKDRWGRACWLKFIVPTSVVVLAGLGFWLYYNKTVTGSALELPYMTYEKTHSRAPVFLWEKFGERPQFARPEEKIYYDYYVVPNSRFDRPIWQVYFARLKETVDNFAGWFGVAGIAIGLLLIIEERKIRWVVCLLGVVSLSFILSYWNAVHYQAPSLVAWMLLMVLGWKHILDLIPDQNRIWAVLLMAGLVIISDNDLYNDQAANFRLMADFSARRVRVADDVINKGGRSIVFVNRGTDKNVHQEWVYNGADLNEGLIIWAHDLGDARNEGLRKLYPDRTCWRLTLAPNSAVLKSMP